MTVDQSLLQAVRLHQSGRFSEAQQLYRQVLSRQPRNPQALHLLGVLLHQGGKSGEALELIRKAIAILPSAAEFHVNLGAVLTALNRNEEAVAAYRKAVKLNPDQPEGQFNLGLALVKVERFDEAAAAFERNVALRPRSAEGFASLGNALHKSGRKEEAAEALRKSLALNPNDLDSMLRLGDLLLRLARLDEAEKVFRAAMALKPGEIGPVVGLSVTLDAMKHAAESLEMARKAVAMEPDSIPALENLANTLKQQCQPSEAVKITARVIAAKPDDADAYNVLGGSYLDMGRYDEAMAGYRKAMELNPSATIYQSNLIYAMNFHPDFDAWAILAEARDWDRRHAAPLRNRIKRHRNSRDPDRRLRIGYVSADLRNHVVGWNLLPLLREHDRGQFEVFCFSGVIRPDKITEKLRACCDQWKDVWPLDDEKLAELVRQEGIDILVDLSLHAGDNRLRTFAMAPAPVQITYLGYCGTTGVSAMNYRFSDPYFDPPEQDLSCYSERTIRLPETFWCYAPADDPPEVAPLPAGRSGQITFGCLNQFQKVSGPCLELWGEILKRTPGSRLILHAPLGEPREHVCQRLSNYDVAAERIEFSDRIPWQQYMRVFDRIDIALDPFPYGGGITTCDTLMMGAAVVSLSGRTTVGRGGRSILSNIGHPELIAYDPGQYVKIAVDLAGDLPRLTELRASLRPKMQSSPLMDAPRFARNVEAAYRQTWRTWCSHDASTAI
jgi:predicted O-linked N-acetylglucosamine transferase (SPINDLY family)